MRKIIGYALLVLIVTGTDLYSQSRNRKPSQPPSGRQPQLQPKPDPYYSVQPNTNLYQLFETSVIEEEKATTISAESPTTTYENPHTKEEIIAKWEELQSPFEGTLFYEENPSWKKPYKAGKLKQGFQDEGLAMINFARYLTGLPEMELNDDDNNIAQHSVVILAAIDELTHEPKQPSDMDDSFYETGGPACFGSSLAAGYWTLESAVLGWLNDIGTDSLGHRMGVLQTYLKKIGLGFCNYYSSMYLCDYTMDDFYAANYDYILWPAPGAFPTDIFSTDAKWSVLLNYEKYQEMQLSKIKVTITRSSDNKTWNLSSSDSSDQGEYLNFADDYTLYLSFRPDVKSYEDGDNFDVTITGIKDKNGKEVEISYTVDFVDMDMDL